MSGIVKSLAFLLLLTSPALAQRRSGGAPEIAKESPGIKNSEKAPEFQLKDQAGKPHSLTSLRKGKFVAIVFYRSGSW